MTKIPLGEWVNQGVDTLLFYFGSAFDAFTDSVTSMTDAIRDGLDVVPWFILILLFAALAWQAKGWRLALGTDSSARHWADRLWSSPR